MCYIFVVLCHLQYNFVLHALPHVLCFFLKFDYHFHMSSSILTILANRSRDNRLDKYELLKRYHVTELNDIARYQFTVYRIEHCALPGQGLSLHVAYSRSFPMQSFPPFLASCFLFLALFCLPPLHVFEHFVHSSHADHMQLTFDKDVF